MENIVVKGTKFIKLFATLSYKTDVCPICGHMHSVICMALINVMFQFIINISSDICPQQYLTKSLKNKIL